MGETHRPGDARRAWLWLASAPLFWAGNFVIGRALRGDAPPVTLNFWRWALALAVLVPLSLGQLRLHRAALLRAWPLVLALGLTGIALYQVLAYAALSQTTAISAALVGATAPLAIALCAWAAYRDPITARQGLGLVAALAGAVVVITRGDLVALLGLRLGQGELLMAAAVGVWAVYSVLLKRAPAGVPGLTLLTASAIAGLALMAPVYLWRLAAGERLTLSPATLLGVGYTALFASVLAFLAWGRGVAALGPSQAAGFINLLPIFTALLSVALLGEQIAPYHLAGAALVFLGIALASRARRS